MCQKTEFYLKDKKYTFVGLISIRYLLDVNTKDSELYQQSIPLLKKLINEEIYTSNPELVQEIFRLYFLLYSNMMYYKDGYNFCKEFLHLLPRTKYSNVRGYFLFFAYQLKNYSEIDEVMNTNIIETSYKTQVDSNDFCLYTFYKGLIHLSKEEYVMAAFSFMICIVPFTKHFPSVIDFLQIESFKRLCLLFHIVDNEFKPMIINILKYLEMLKHSPKLSPFFEIIELRNDPYILLEQFINTKKTFLRSNNLYGLAKKALWETRFKAVTEVLCKYKRIKLTKVSNMVNLKMQNVVKVLEMNVAKNRINVRYDEVEDILEVIKCSMNNPESFEELKKYYKYLIASCQDLFTYDMTKINESKKFASMKPEELADLVQRQHEVDFDNDVVDMDPMMEDAI